MARDDSENRDMRPSKAQIDENLKRVYDDLIDAEIPDRFSQLLAQLKAKEGTDRGEK